MPATLLLFWDYDTQWGADRSRSPGGPKGWGPLEFENTERLLVLHEQYGVKACFAVVGAAALPGEQPYHDPGQIREIHQAGHEIASHTFKHEWIPGLGYEGLLETLRQSKEALEDCIGAPVTAFVPPYNQPWDYPGKLAISLSERREAKSGRTDLPGLCKCLREAGYRFARVTYHPLPEHIWLRLFRRRLFKAGKLERIGGLTCVRLNTPCGFAERTLRVVEYFAKQGKGIVVVYAHPHSLNSGGPQDEKYLIPFFDRVAELRAEGRLEVVLPRDLVGQGK